MTCRENGGNDGPELGFVSTRLTIIALRENVHQEMFPEWWAQSALCITSPTDTAMAKAVNVNLEIGQMDVKAAYLKSFLEEDAPILEKVMMKIE
ncbi:hypothetical protein PR048_028330 [Dryococelus australis]|uniref:Uncharacterized protein n=1 Tax=Dryococelus australis TaxID=614101 RepID=A0ABQ9GJ00_9NEOP|nr:hypothetical protein PR048_028330 [Dryococelus australis]